MQVSSFQRPEQFSFFIFEDIFDRFPLKKKLQCYNRVNYDVLLQQNKAKLKNHL